MLKTPGTLELARRLASLASLGGLDDRPWTAESTLDKGAGAASADMVDEGLLLVIREIEVKAGCSWYLTNRNRKIEYQIVAWGSC